uniref:Uncharacterized protein n=1 Tax=Kalanchoe fedtschenkoi TaxID=63787 RepID=A0A7N0ZUL9_KALFE
MVKTGGKPHLLHFLHLVSISVSVSLTVTVTVSVSVSVTFLGFSSSLVVVKSSFLPVIPMVRQDDGAHKVAKKDYDDGDGKSGLIVLSSPLAVDGDYSAGSSSSGAPNLMQRVFSLFKNVRPGSDLTSFQLPPQFNIPKSQLQCYGEGIYCIAKDLLSQCSSGKTPLDRITAVVAWSLSTARPLMFGFAPYNPILGETHHGSRGTLNVLVEQVSHHPPVTALHATDEKDNVEVLTCQHPVPKFYVSNETGYETYYVISLTRWYAFLNTISSFLNFTGLQVTVN